MKYFRIIIFIIISIFLIFKALDRFKELNGEAGYLFVFGAIAFGLAAVLFALPLFKKNK